MTSAGVSIIAINIILHPSYYYYIILLYYCPSSFIHSAISVRVILCLRSRHSWLKRSKNNRIELSKQMMVLKPECFRRRQSESQRLFSYRESIIKPRLNQLCRRYTLQFRRMSWIRKKRSKLIIIIKRAGRRDFI